MMAAWEFFLRLAAFLASLLPPCPVHTFLGVPCPSCGTTRAVLLLLHGEIGRAFLMNPLIIGGGAMGFGYIVIGLVIHARTGRFPEPRWTPVRRRVLRWTVGVVVLVNWAWLVWTGV